MSRNRASAKQSIALPWSKPPLSLNDRHHWRTKAKITANIRAVVTILARGLEPVEKATVTLHYQPRDNRRRDAMNLAPTLKPCTDALVDAGILRDDNSQLVTENCRIEPVVAGEGARMWLTVEEEK